MKDCDRHYRNSGTSHRSELSINEQRAALKNIEQDVMRKTELIQCQLQNLPANSDEKIAQFKKVNDASQYYRRTIQTTVQNRCPRTRNK